MSSIILVVHDAELGKVPDYLRQKGHTVTVFHPSDELRTAANQHTYPGIMAALAYESYMRQVLDTVDASDHVLVTDECKDSHLGSAVLGYMSASSDRYPIHESDLLVLLDEVRRFE